MSKSIGMKAGQGRMVFFCGITLLSILGCNIKNNSKTEQSKRHNPTTKIKFSKRVYDFGKISAGKKVEYKYEFKNVGNIPLQINDVYTSCGCTVPTYSHKPIMPGEGSSIDVVFETENATGIQKKAVTIVSNADPSTTEIYLVGEVTSNKFFDQGKSAHL